MFTIDLAFFTQAWNIVGDTVYFLIIYFGLENFLFNLILIKN